MYNLRITSTRRDKWKSSDVSTLNFECLKWKGNEKLRHAGMLRTASLGSTEDWVLSGVWCGVAVEWGVGLGALGWRLRADSIEMLSLSSHSLPFHSTLLCSLTYDAVLWRVDYSRCASGVGVSQGSGCCAIFSFCAHPLRFSFNCTLLQLPLLPLHHWHHIAPVAGVLVKRWAHTLHLLLHSRSIVKLKIYFCV